jgi:pre-mRNA-processing factor 19
MSFNICSISGMTLINPVVSKKSGFVFEKRLIEKHIEATGRCPITKHELSKDDLIEIKNERKINLAQPRSVNLVSIPGMFSELQKEWDSLLLETHLLKKELDVARQELAHSMYQSDASCRVICNLLKEKEFAREELANYKLEFEDADDEGFSGEESDYMGITKELTSRIEEFTYKSIAERKQRKILDNFAKFQDLKSYELKLRYYPFKGVKSKSLVNTSIGITSSANNNKSNHIVLGTNDGTLGLCELKSESKGYIIENKLILNAHNKKINDVQIYPSNEILGFATGSDDGTCAFYINNSSKDIKISERYRTNNTIHLEAITSISFHPLEEYALISSLDGSWSFHNLIKVNIL